jgi:hypothetical protein
LAIEGGTNFMAYLNVLHNHNQYLENNLGPTIVPWYQSEQEFTYEDTNPIFESATGSPESHSKTWFHLPQEYLLETLRITCLHKVIWQVSNNF